MIGSKRDYLAGMHGYPDLWSFVPSLREIVGQYGVWPDRCKVRLSPRPARLCLWVDGGDGTGVKPWCERSVEAFAAFRGETSRRQADRCCELAVARGLPPNRTPTCARPSSPWRPPRPLQRGRQSPMPIVATRTDGNGRVAVRARETTAGRGNRRRANRGLAGRSRRTIKQPQAPPISRERKRRCQRWRLTGLLSRSQAKHQSKPHNDRS